MIAAVPPDDAPVVVGDCSPMWHAFRRDRSDVVRQQLVERYMDFARKVAGHVFARRSYLELEFGDYLQFARLGLLEAVDRYDIALGASFETYAARRITGAILSGIQSYSDLQEQVAVRKRIVADRVGTLRGVAPDGSDSDTLFDYLAEVAIGLAVGFALEESGMYLAQEPEYPDNTYSGVEMRQLRNRLLACMQGLPERQRKVLHAHYLQQLPFEQVAGMLGLSRGRVSQLHKEGLLALRALLRDSGGIDFVF